MGEDQRLATTSELLVIFDVFSRIRERMPVECTVSICQFRNQEDIKFMIQTSINGKLYGSSFHLSPEDINADDVEMRMKHIEWSLLNCMKKLRHTPSRENRVNDINNVIPYTIEDIEG